jgi:predicted transcriptional regulator
MTELEHSKALLSLTADIVSAHARNNPLPAADLPALIEQVYLALRDVGTLADAAPQHAVRPEPERPAPVVSPRKSVFPDYIICLEDGRKLKTLKRHLRSTYNLTPEQYREKWDLAADYPMVAPNYAERRSALAKKLGLGRKPANAAAKPGIPELEPERAPPPAATPPAIRTAAPAPIMPDPTPTRAREGREHTAASVFAKFPRQEEVVTEVTAADLDGRKTRRKPFSKQLARNMRP